MRQRPHDAITDKIAIGRIGDMLELAAAALGNVAARRNDMARPRHDDRLIAIEAHPVPHRRADDKATRRRGAIAARGETDDQLAVARTI